MKLRSWAVVCGAAAALPACLSPTDTAPTCVPVTSQQQEMRGDTVVTTTGLRYIVLEPGTGPQLQGCGRALLHYELMVGGDTIESSRDRPGTAVTDFGFGFVVAGFDEGLAGMQAGEHRRLIVPPALGYGSDPVPDPQNRDIILIPPNSTLIFDVELLEFELMQPG